MSEKKKPVKLVWQGDLAPSAPLDGAQAVRIKGTNRVQQASTAASNASGWKGSCKARREVKGRGGKPVIVLHAFEPRASMAQRELLCRVLKETLACGGTADNPDGGIVVQVDDFPRVEKVCAALGVKVVRAGGFG